MSDKHPEIECYECGRLKTRLIWNSRCVTCTVQRLEANLEENDNLRDQLAALEEENERLKARVAELAAPDVQGEPVAYLRKDHLTRVKRMGPMLGEIADSPRTDRVPVYAAPQPAEQKPAPDVSGLAERCDKVIIDLAAHRKGDQS